MAWHWVTCASCAAAPPRRQAPARRHAERSVAIPAAAPAPVPGRAPSCPAPMHNRCRRHAGRTQRGEAVLHAVGKHRLHRRRGTVELRGARPAVARGVTRGPCRCTRSRPSRSAEHGVDGVVERLSDVGVIGDRAYQRHAAGVGRGHATDHQRPGIDQQPGRYALGQAMTLELTRCMGDLHQLRGTGVVEPAFLARRCALRGRLRR